MQTRSTSTLSQSGRIGDLARSLLRIGEECQQKLIRGPFRRDGAIGVRFPRKAPCDLLPEIHCQDCVLSRANLEALPMLSQDEFDLATFCLDSPWRGPMRNRLLGRGHVVWRCAA